MWFLDAHWLIRRPMLKNYTIPKHYNVYSYRFVSHSINFALLAHFWFLRPLIAFPRALMLCIHSLEVIESIFRPPSLIIALSSWFLNLRTPFLTLPSRFLASRSSFLTLESQFLAIFWYFSSIFDIFSEIRAGPRGADSEIPIASIKNPFGALFYPKIDCFEGFQAVFDRFWPDFQVFERFLTLFWLESAQIWPKTPKNPRETRKIGTFWAKIGLKT